MLQPSSVLRSRMLQPSSATVICFTCAVTTLIPAAPAPDTLSQYRGRTMHILTLYMIPDIA
eukprot:1635553-Rhodomonas_salina.1